MLNKFITSMKEKSLRKESEVIDDVQHSFKDDETVDASNEKGETSEKEKQQKRNSMIIRVIVVIALAYFFVTEFVLKKEESVAQPEAVKPRRAKKEIVVDKDAKPQTDKVKEETKKEEMVQTVTSPTIEPSAPVEIQPPVENINIADNKSGPIQSPNVEEVLPQMREVKTNEALVDKKIDGLIESVESAGKESNEVNKQATVSLEDKIVADDNYVSPPTYEQLGRGLVYNCKEKYWACLDKSSYLICNKNSKWNKAHGKQAECVVQNVYNSDEDCNIIQKYNVSSSKSTDFCSGN